MSPWSTTATDQTLSYFYYDEPQRRSVDQSIDAGQGAAHGGQLR